MRGAGNTEGGWGKFLAGVALLGIGVYLLLDSVRATTGGAGLITGLMLDGFGWHGADGQTTSMGIIFVPLFVGIGRKIGTVTYFRSRGRGAKIGDCPYFWRRVC